MCARMEAMMPSTNTALASSNALGLSKVANNKDLAVMAGMGAAAPCRALRHNRHAKYHKYTAPKALVTLGRCGSHCASCAMPPPQKLMAIT